MPTRSAGTFTITVRDHSGVLLSDVLRGVGNLAAGSPCTVSDIYNTTVGSGSTLLAMQLAASYSQVVTSADGTFDIADAPAGFTPTTNLRAHFARAFELKAGDVLTLEDLGVVASVHNGPLAESSVNSEALVLPDGRSLVLLSTDIFRWRKEGSGGAGISYVIVPYIPNTQTVDAGVCGGPALQIAALAITGDYVILISWWKRPPKDSCGNPQDPHLAFAGAAPGPDWEPFDPGDPEAAPVPTIATLEPDHGPVAGGALVTIRGSGFGDACVLTVDGVTVARTVVDSNTITYTAPPHAAGDVAVVVTNEDGTATP